MIAAVSGHAVAGGLEMALMCDMRVAEEDAVFGVFCRRFGTKKLNKNVFSVYSGTSEIRTPWDLAKVSLFQRRP